MIDRKAHDSLLIVVNNDVGQIFEDPQHLFLTDEISVNRAAVLAQEELRLLIAPIKHVGLRWEGLAPRRLVAPLILSGRKVTRRKAVLSHDIMLKSADGRHGLFLKHTFSLGFRLLPRHGEVREVRVDPCQQVHV